MKRMKIFITLLAGMLCLPVVMHAQIKANKDSVAVAEYLQRANDGDAVAQNRVGLWYYTGVGGLDKDYTMAAKWWALAAQQGNSDAVGNLAMCYQLGNGVEADSTTAAKLYIRSIHDGNSRLLEQHERLATKGKLFSAMLLYDIYLHGKAGMAPVAVPIRGGTDGARLSYEGLPCPNLCTGGENYHGRYEYIPIEDMEQCVEMIKFILTDGSVISG